jgi:hypothetical protein
VRRSTQGSDDSTATSWDQVFGRQPPPRRWRSGFAAGDTILTNLSNLSLSRDEAWPRRSALKNASGHAPRPGPDLALMQQARAVRLQLSGAITPGTPWGSNVVRDGDSLKTNEYLDQTCSSNSGWLNPA